MARTVGSSGSKTEARIRQVAVGLIARHSFAAVSMRDLGRAAGIGAPALYRYFPTKQALLASIMHATLDRWAAEWAQQMQPEAGQEADPQTGPEAELMALTGFHVRFNSANRIENEIIVHEWRALERDNLSAIARKRGAQERLLREILRRGAAAGRMRIEDVALTANAISQMLAGVALWYRPEGGAAIGAVVANYQVMVRRLVGLPEAAPSGPEG
jgi:AcrR family transcriptional regulator